DTDSAAPRICLVFSDALPANRPDLADFVTVDNGSGLAIEPADHSICVNGVKHGSSYHLRVRGGLPAADGETLLHPVELDVYIPDRAPFIGFAGNAYVLPAGKDASIPLTSVNTDRAKAAIYRIGDRALASEVRDENFLHQLDQYSADFIKNSSGEKIWEGEIGIASKLNENVTTAIPVAQVLPAMKPGIYVITAKPAIDQRDEFSTLATQWFVVSDLGLTAFSGEDGIQALVRSLATAEPLAGVELKLVARNNEILATQTTDASGYVRFDPGLARGTGGLSPGLLVATDAKGDYGFLDLAQPAFDLTDRGVKGRTAPKALDALLYTERGVYRSGETVYLTALLRDPKGIAVSGLPLTIIVRRPDGVEYKRALVADQGLGGRALNIPLLSGSATGTWRAEAYSDPKGDAIGSTSFLVEDYIPERLDVRLKPKQTALKSGEPAEIEVDAKYLYGAPGANLEVSGDVTVEASTTSLPGLAGYSIGLTDESFENVTGEIEEKPTTDAKGHATVTATIPAVETPKPVEATVVLRVGEQGGRAVERTLILPILPKGTSIAVKKDFDEAGLSEGSLANFDVVALAADGTRIAKKNVSWSLYRVDKTYQWFNTEGRWGYEPVTTTRRIADGKVDVTADSPARIAANVGWGAHRLDIRSDDGQGSQTSISFDVGWSGDATAQTPDLLDVSLDRTRYKPGDELKLRIASRFDGKATIAIVSDKVQTFKTLNVKKGDNVLSIPVASEWGAGAYAIAIAHRPLDAAAQRMPGRALGLAWFSIDDASRKLEVSIDAPDKVRPRGPIKLPIKLAGLSPGEEANVTVAAVDVGILNLTHYEAPDPFDVFFGQRQLATDIRDLYGLLIDGMQGTRGAIRSGSDAAGKGLEGEVPTQEPLARYSGVVRVGPDGTAEVSFDLPAFNGTIRVMTVAWSKTRVGSATADVIVRDPVVVAGTLPRFMSLGDQSRFFVEIDNVEGQAGDYTVDLDVHGPVVVAADATRKTVKLEGSGRTSLTIPVTAAGIGTAVIDLRLTGPGVDATQSFALKVEPGTPELYRRTVRSLQPGTSVTISDDLIADFVPGTGAVSVAVSAIGAIDVPALLQALDRYPYGCSEQTVSRAMPLLYVNKLATVEQLAFDGAIDDRIRDAIDREMARQDSNGSFGLWSANNTDDDLWLDAFVTDFLTRARERGFTVPQKGFDQAVDHLRNLVVNATDIEAGKGEPIAYAAYVLARNGRPVMADLRYLADTKLDAFKTPLARAQIAAALALLGDRGRAQNVFNAAVSDLEAAKDDKISRPDYGSRLRDGAATLALLAESGIGRESILKVSNVVEDAAANTGYTSTQEKAWMVLAAQALAKETDTLSLSIDGTTRTGAYFRTWRGFSLDGKPVTIANNSPAEARLVITTSGHPTVEEPAASHGYQIERSFYKLDGTKIEPTSIKQNDRLVVVLKVTEPEALYAKLLLVDLLPAGLEIDNPELVDGGSIEGLSWLKKDIDPSHTEYRDDRFVAAFDRDSGQSAFFSVAYVVRAVAPGKYVLPPATVEDMYRPDRYGRTAFGTVEVTPAKQ
ncbi:MAG: alpha-2-macroglobulin family protein, partial [Methylobacteriaceae bacterium]|nr:alpha-2-macroglobulin family protein [Methylobacteriaceae bacterium]